MDIVSLRISIMEMLVEGAAMGVVRVSLSEKAKSFVA